MRSGLGLAASLERLGTETAFSVLARARELEREGREIVHLEIGEPDFESLQRRVLQRDAAGQCCILIADDLVGAEQRFEAAHFGSDGRER